jgi:hypothetical protein
MNREQQWLTKPFLQPNQGVELLFIHPYKHSINEGAAAEYLIKSCPLVAFQLFSAKEISWAIQAFQLHGDLYTLYF